MPSPLPGHLYQPSRRVRELLPACCCGWSGDEWIRDEPADRRLREAYQSLPPGLHEWLDHLAREAALAQLVDDWIADMGRLGYFGELPDFLSHLILGPAC